MGHHIGGRETEWSFFLPPQYGNTVLATYLYRPGINMTPTESGSSYRIYCGQVDADPL